METTRSEGIEIIKRKYKSLKSCLNERSRRIWASTEARGYGYGGIQVVYEATGITYKTIKRGLDELENPGVVGVNHVRNAGSGRPKQTIQDPTLLRDIKSCIEPITRGDPESPLLWVSKSTYNLSKLLQAQGHKICQRSVCTRLSELGFSLQGNKKTKEGSSHEDRDA
jgi:transposase